jgi:hypothetical protein
MLGLPEGAASALVGLGLWLLHWGRLAEARLLGPDVVGQDRRATLRSVYLFLALAWVVGGTLGGVSQLLYYGLARALGVERPGGVGGDLALAAAGPGSLALVYGVGWAYQRSVIRQQARAIEAARQAGVRRLYTYLVALVALLALAGGVGGLLWTLADLITGAGAENSSSRNQVRDQVAQFATLALVGLAVWLLHWRPSGALSVAETQALSRRLYTYLALIGGTLGLLGSAAVAAAQVLDLALGAPAGEPLRTNLAHAGSVAAIAAALVAYHWQSLRADTRRAATAGGPTHPSPGPSVTSAADTAAPPLANQRLAAPATLLVKLRAPDSDTLADALAALREGGVEVEIAAEPDGP